MSGKPLAQWHIPSALCTLFLSLLLAGQPRVALSQSLRGEGWSAEHGVSFPKSQRVWATSLGQSWGPGVSLWHPGVSALSVPSTWNLEWTPDTEGWNCSRLSSPCRLQSHIPSTPVEEVMTVSQRGTEEAQRRSSKEGDLWFPGSSQGWLGLEWSEDRRGWGDALGLEGLSARSLKCVLISPPKGYSIPSLGQSESAPAPPPPPPMGGPGPGSTVFCAGTARTLWPRTSLGLLLPTSI